MNIKINKKMKIQLDTTNKTIKIEEKVNLVQLMKIIKQILPNNQWRDYSLEQSVITNWANPWAIQPYRVYDYPWVPTTIYSGTGSADVVLPTNTANSVPGNSSYTNSVFNIEVN